MDLDGLRRDEEGLRDLTVRASGGSEVGDTALARGQRGHTLERRRARARAGRIELRADMLGKGGCAADVGQLEREAERLSRVGRPPRMAKRRAERGQRLGVLEPRRRPVQHVDSLLQPIDSPVPLEHAENTERAAERPRSAPPPGELDLFVRTCQRVDAASRAVERLRPERAPGPLCGIPDMRPPALELAHGRERILGATLCEKQLQSAVQPVAARVARRLRLAGAREGAARTVEIAALQEYAGQDRAAVDGRDRAEAPDREVAVGRLERLLRLDQLAAPVEGEAVPEVEAADGEEGAAAMRLGERRVPD